MPAMQKQVGRSTAEDLCPHEGKCTGRQGCAAAGECCRACCGGLARAVRHPGSTAPNTECQREPAIKAAGRGRAVHLHTQVAHPQ